MRNDKKGQARFRTKAMHEKADRMSSITSMIRRVENKPFDVKYCFFKIFLILCEIILEEKL
jgi:hypothetical protein